MTRIPSKIEPGGGGFFGRPLRDVWICGMGIALGILALMGLQGLPLWLRISLGLFLAGAGLVIGLGRDKGVWRFEERLVHLLSHKARRRQWVWRKETPGEEPVTVAVTEVEPRDKRQGFEVKPLVGLWWGLVSAFVFSMMGGVTTYLATGGMEDLLLWWELVSRRM